MPNGSRLGPTHPRLINIAEETLDFRRPGLSPGFNATHTGILTSASSISPLRADFNLEQNAPLPSRALREKIQSTNFETRNNVQNLNVKIQNRLV